MRVVEITSNNKRVHEIKEGDIAAHMRRYPNDVPNPKTPMGVAPQYWKPDGKNFKTMTSKEMAAVDADHEKNGVDNGRASPKTSVIQNTARTKAQIPGWVWVSFGVLSGIASTLLLLRAHL